MLWIHCENLALYCLPSKGNNTGGDSNSLDSPPPKLSTVPHWPLNSLTLEVAFHQKDALACLPLPYTKSYCPRLIWTLWSILKKPIIPLLILSKSTKENIPCVLYSNISEGYLAWFIGTISLHSIKNKVCIHFPRFGYYQTNNEQPHTMMWHHRNWIPIPRCQYFGFLLYNLLWKCNTIFWWKQSCITLSQML